MNDDGVTDQRITDDTVQEARAFIADAAVGATVEPRMLRIARALVDTTDEVFRLRQVVQDLKTLVDATDEASLRPDLPDFEPIEVPWTVAVRVALSAVEGLPRSDEA